MFAKNSSTASYSHRQPKNSQSDKMLFILGLFAIAMCVGLVFFPVDTQAQNESEDHVSSATAIKSDEASTVQEKPLDMTISLNDSDAKSLSQLSGIGMVKAQAIVDWRKYNGPFVSINQLAEVKGIGMSTVNKNRDKLTL